MKYKKPEQQQIDFWLEYSQKDIDRRLGNNILDFYEEKDLPVQGLYTGLASAHYDLACAQFLNGESSEVFRENFSKAVGYIIKSFTMAYDKNDPDYVGDKEPPDNSGFGYGYVDWANVEETDFIDGINYAMMAADFEKAQELAKLYRNSPDGHLMDKEVNRYAHALKFAILGYKDPAKGLLEQTINEQEKKQSKQPFKLNYLTLSIALYGMLDNDETLFNEGLAMQLTFYEPSTFGEIKDSEEAFICTNAVALANLAIGFKMKVTVEHRLMPKGMVIPF